MASEDQKKRKRWYRREVPAPDSRIVLCVFFQSAILGNFLSSNASLTSKVLAASLFLALASLILLASVLVPRPEPETEAHENL